MLISRIEHREIIIGNFRILGIAKLRYSGILGIYLILYGDDDFDCTDSCQTVSGESLE